MAPAEDSKSVTLGFGEVMMIKRREGQSIGIAFARGEEELFTVWFANSKGADALASNVATASRILGRQESGQQQPEREWQVVRPTPSVGEQKL